MKHYIKRIDLELLSKHIACVGDYGGKGVISSNSVEILYKMYAYMSVQRVQST